MAVAVDHGAKRMSPTDALVVSSYRIPSIPSCVDGRLTIHAGLF